MGEVAGFYHMIQQVIYAREWISIKLSTSSVLGNLYTCRHCYTSCILKGWVPHRAKFMDISIPFWGICLTNDGSQQARVDSCDVAAWLGLYCLALDLSNMWLNIELVCLEPQAHLKSWCTLYSNMLSLIRPIYDIPLPNWHMLHWYHQPQDCAKNQSKLCYCGTIQTVKTEMNEGKHSQTQHLEIQSNYA